MLEQILWTAMVTPFQNNGEKIDYISFKNLITNQEKAGNGVLILGSTGESISLNEQEKRELVDFTINSNVTSGIVVGIAGHNLPACLELIDYCNSLPITGYLMTTPIYSKPGEKGQSLWFEKLLNKSTKPAMLYNIPSRAGVRLHPSTVHNLSSHPNFLAIKDSSGGLEAIKEYRSLAENIKIYCGDDAMMPSMAENGAIGLVSVASNVCPEKTRDYVKTALARKYIDMSIWQKINDVLFCASNPIPVKKLLAEMGVIASGELRLPLTMEELSGKILKDSLTHSFFKG
jgi:4-hydroxy-tetrahydrodipicolinate synthase